MDRLANYSKLSPCAPKGAAVQLNKWYAHLTVTVISAITRLVLIDRKLAYYTTGYAPRQPGFRLCPQAARVQAMPRRSGVAQQHGLTWW